MKRPLVVITAGFVLGEVLALCLQEAVYRKCFWFAGALFLAALIARHFLGKDQDRYGKRPEPGSGWKFRQECHIQDTSAYFYVYF